MKSLSTFQSCSEETSKNCLPKYCSFQSEQRTFQRRYLLQKPLSPTLLPRLKEQWSDPNKNYQARMPEQKRNLKKSQLMLSRDDRIRRQSSGKRFRVGVCKNPQKHLETDHQRGLDTILVESSTQRPAKVVNNSPGDDTGETMKVVSNEIFDSQRTCDTLESSSSIDENQFLLTFPRRERGYVTIRAEDIKLLQPCGMLNDNLVDFMLKYIELYQVPYELQEKVHFFNSFFFTRLQSLSGPTGHRDIESLSRWTSGVEIFSKKFLFVPICMHHHWTLAIVCNPGNVFGWNSNSRDPTGRPCILYFDSLGTYTFSRNCQRLLRSYLEMEWRKRRSSCQVEEARKGIGSRISWENIPILNILAPQQKNEFDCGLFMLQYIIRFLVEPPNGGVLTRRSDLHVENWFTDEDIKVFREKIRQLIVDLANYYMNHPMDEPTGNRSLCIEQSSPL